MITFEQQENIKRILAPFNPEYIGIFGSYARGDQHESSDLDILVRFNSPLTLFDLVGLEEELAESLGLDVDLVTENSLSPLIREYVVKDLKQIA